MRSTGSKLPVAQTSPNKTPLHRMNGKEGAIAHSTVGRALLPDVVRSQLLFDVFADAVFHFFVAALNLISGTVDELGGTEAEDVFLVLEVLAAGNEAGLDNGGSLQLPAALTATAEEEFSDGDSGRE